MCCGWSADRACLWLSTMHFSIHCLIYTHINNPQPKFTHSPCASLPESKTFWVWQMLSGIITKGKDPNTLIYVNTVLWSTLPSLCFFDLRIYRSISCAPEMIQHNIEIHSTLKSACNGHWTIISSDSHSHRFWLFLDLWGWYITVNPPEWRNGSSGRKLW